MYTSIQDHPIQQPRDGPEQGRGVQLPGRPYPLAQLITRACAKHFGIRPLD